MVAEEADGPDPPACTSSSSGRSGATAPAAVPGSPEGGAPVGTCRDVKEVIRIKRGKEQFSTFKKKKYAEECDIQSLLTSGGLRTGSGLTKEAIRSSKSRPASLMTSSGVSSSQVVMESKEANPSRFLLMLTCLRALLRLFEAPFSTASSILTAMETGRRKHQYTVKLAIRSLYVC